jgi:hypothetical protein
MDRAEKASMEVAGGAAVKSIRYDGSLGLRGWAPSMCTLESAGDMDSFIEGIQTKLVSLKDSIRHTARVCIIASVKYETPSTEISVVASDSSHKRVHSEIKAIPSKKPRDTPTSRQLATESFISDAVGESLLTITAHHKCVRKSCHNFEGLCYDLGPSLGHIKLNQGHLREWNQAIKDDPGNISARQPPMVMVTRMVIEKQQQVAKKKDVSNISIPQTLNMPIIPGSGINLNFNMTSGLPDWLSQILPSEAKADAASKSTAEQQPQALHTALPPPSSPIPAVEDEDMRLTAYITARVEARPLQRVEFERAANALSMAGVGFTDLATLTEREWDAMDIWVGIKKDLLKNRKQWHRDHPERHLRDGDGYEHSLSPLASFVDRD